MSESQLTDGRDLCKACDEADEVLVIAEQEWERFGVLSASTYIALNNAGLDAEKVIERLES